MEEKEKAKLVGCSLNSTHAGRAGVRTPRALRFDCLSFLSNSLLYLHVIGLFSLDFFSSRLCKLVLSFT